jgi:hypothetical protein
MSPARLDRRIQLSSGLPLGLALGAGIWVLSGSITGRAEPWDSPSQVYVAELIGAGVVGGLLIPAHWIEVAVGIFTGQALVLLARVMAEPAEGGLWPLGLLFLAIYSLLALFGSVLGATVRRFLGPTG